MAAVLPRARSDSAVEGGVCSEVRADVYLRTPHPASIGQCESANLTWELAQESGGTSDLGSNTATQPQAKREEEAACLL